MSDVPEITEIKAVSIGGKFCECGGLMILEYGNCFMASLPKQKIYCPFCGNTEYVEAPYEIDIQFKKV